MIAWGVNPQLCRGTSHALGDNLAHMMSHNHVDYIEANGVERILVDKGQATVVLEDGTVIKARKFIASNVNPVETFIKLVGARISSRNLLMGRRASDFPKRRRSLRLTWL